MQNEALNDLKKIFKEYYGKEVEKCIPLTSGGSYRRYWKMNCSDENVIGAYNSCIQENDAFISFSKSFFKEGIAVPEIFAETREKGVYLLEYLGDETFLDFFNHNYNQNYKDFDLMLKSVLKGLIDIQLKGKSCIDYSKCIPKSDFDRYSMMWDLNYFKYFFLKLLRVPFDEQLLEYDFQNLCDFLLSAQRDYFLFRDFQSANIMIKENKPFYIDYQGGRRGALQYDPASLLYDAKICLSKNEREMYIHYYMSELSKKTEVNEVEFLKHYRGFVILRLLQALGAFGFRGVVEHKPGFVESIAPALIFIKEIFEDNLFPISLPELSKCFFRMLESKYIKEVISNN